MGSGFDPQAAHHHSRSSVRDQLGPDHGSVKLPLSNHRVHQAGPTRPGRTAAASGYALAPASLRERAGRLARDTVGPAMIMQWLHPGEGGADCAEPPPSVQPAARPDPCGPSIVGSERHGGKPVTSGGAARIGSKRLDPGPYDASGCRLSPAARGLPWMTRVSLSLYSHAVRSPGLLKLLTPFHIDRHARVAGRIREGPTGDQPLTTLVVALIARA